ncbi:RNA-binding domain-containing protein [Aspergillus ellipticus CBS 707.79]|uniref:RNA-binding domain-containing protein n=1 Tax=Aspergillus ellipticus CBS 707.79 TaxID=1448320 RepID=A0A319F084_9EURO|nr:RNA-binding domain-containing protein [Aspergillus ellipticus CBS 707.79]
MHCFRRAACRVLTSSPASLRSRRAAIPSLSARLSIPLRTSHLSLQSRWNTTDAKPEPTNTEAPAESREEPVTETTTQHTEQTEAKPEAEATTQPSERSEAKPVESEAEPLQEPEPTYQNRTRRLQRLRQRASPKETVFVGNMFYDVTAEDLRAQMEKYGIVTRAMVVLDNRGISKGFGYVQFDSVDTATRAIEAMHLRVWEGRRLNVDFAQNNIDMGNVGAPSRTLYIGNMPFEMTDRDLNDLFKDIANVIDVRVSVDRRTGQPRGFAHADFTNVHSARVAMNNLVARTPYGRRLVVNFSNSTRGKQNKEPRERGEGEEEEI